MGNIAILVHKNDRFEAMHYFLHAISEIWRESGWEMRVLQGPQGKISADLAILHVDLTRVPNRYLKYLEQFPKVLNGQVADISKKRISRNLVERGDDYDGPVIVKTNRNYGGLGEAMHVSETIGVPRLAHALRRRLPWSMRDALAVSEYRVFQTKKEVPFPVWVNRDLVVERFLPEMHDGFYCLRTWVFFGDRETNSLSYSNEPVVKSTNIIKREAVPQVPEELREVRRKLGFDYGKFDYSIVERRVVLYDANRTPTLGAFPRDQYLPRVRHLAEGLKAFL